MQIQNANSLRPAVSNKVPLSAFGLPQLPPPAVKLVGATQIEVQIVLPYEVVLEAIQWAINYILDDRTFISAPLREIITTVAIVKYWTNVDCEKVDDIAFDPNQLYEYYDMFMHFGIVDAARELINKKQLAFFERTLAATLDSLVSYRNSASGIIEQLRGEAKEDEFNLTSALDLLNNGAEMDMVRKVMRVVTDEASSIESVSEEASDE